MNILVTLTRDTAISAICQHLYNKGEKVNSKNFIKICSGFVFSYGRSHNDDMQWDYENYYFEAQDIVDKYYK